MAGSKMTLLLLFVASPGPEFATLTEVTRMCVTRSHLLMEFKSAGRGEVTVPWEMAEMHGHGLFQ